MSYDQHQLDAREVSCKECGRTFFMTKPQEKCIECREKSSKMSGAREC